jgi:Meiotically up-regulated gene 113
LITSRFGYVSRENDISTLRDGGGSLPIFLPTPLPSCEPETTMPIIARNTNAKPKPRIDENNIAPLVEGLGQIYLVVCAGSDLYKLGYTRQSITKLTSDLQRGNPQPIRVISSFFSINPEADETELHDRFSNKRVKVETASEWFRLTRDDIHNLLLEFRERNEAFRVFLIRKLGGKVE